jgi:hypothetical protein
MMVAPPDMLALLKSTFHALALICQNVLQYFLLYSLSLLSLVAVITRSELFKVNVVNVKIGS